MMLFRPAIAVSLIFLLLSCASQQKKAEAELAGQSYAGVVPCADCEGIAYRLSFYANSQFESSSMYIGESNKKFKREGSWRMEADSSIVLQPEDGEDQKFKIKGEELLWLDRAGNEIQGKLASLYVLQNTGKYPLEGWTKADVDSSVGFKAHGNEPFWGLEIDFKKNMAFNMLDGDSISTPVPEVEQDSASGVRAYKAEVESGTLAVELLPIGCIDSMSGQVYDYRVQITVNGEEYWGCGSYTSK